MKVAFLFLTSSVLWHSCSVSSVLCQSGPRARSSAGPPSMQSVLQGLLSQMITYPVATNSGQHRNGSFAVLQSFGLQPQTIEVVSSTAIGLVSLLRPLVQPLVRAAGVLVGVLQTLRTLFPDTLGRFLPSVTLLPGILGNVAAELGLGALAQQLNVSNFAGPQYSATWTAWMESCQGRALCDLGRFLAQSSPTLTPFIEVFGPAMGLPGPFLVHLKRGFPAQASCRDLYVNCPYLSE